MIKAILISPITVIPAFVFMCVLQGTYEFIMEGSISRAYNDFNNGFFVVSVGGWLYGFILVVFYGLPVYYLLKRKNRYSLRNILIAAICPALLLFSILPILDGFSTNAVLGFLLMAYFSGCVAYVFWLLAPRP